MFILRDPSPPDRILRFPTQLAADVLVASYYHEMRETVVTITGCNETAHRIACLKCRRLEGIQFNLGSGSWLLT